MGIKNFNVGEAFEGILLIKNSKKGKTTKGSDFITLTLSDATGDITANIWDSTTEHEQTLLPGSALLVSGKISDYQGRKQIAIKSFRLTTQEDNVDFSQLIQKAPLDPNQMLTEIVAEVNSMENKNIKAITYEILKQNADKFKTHPAAKHVHHAYMSGLIFHTYSMLQLGKEICKLYPILNKDLLLAGIIIHDIGKIVEYSGFTNTEPTLDGKLRGHITIMSEEIAMVAKSLNLQDTQEKLLLQHMVLSHHGPLSLGWGSAATPQIIEANVLWRIDTIDAELEMYKTAVENTQIHKFTQRIWGMDNREFYNHGL